MDIAVLTSPSRRVVSVSRVDSVIYPSAVYIDKAKVSSVLAMQGSWLVAMFAVISDMFITLLYIVSNCHELSFVCPAYLNLSHEGNMG